MFLCFLVSNIQRYWHVGLGKQLLLLVDLIRFQKNMDIKHIVIIVIFVPMGMIHMTGLTYPAKTNQIVITQD